MPKLFQVLLKEHRRVCRPIEIVFTEPLDKVEDPFITINAWTEYTTRAYTVVGTDDDTDETIKKRLLKYTKEIINEGDKCFYDFEVEKVDFVREVEYEEFDDCPPL